MQRPSTAAVKKSERTFSKSPSRPFAPTFGATTSAAKDSVDPIYDNKDPITASIKQRKDAGNILT